MKKPDWNKNLQPFQTISLAEIGQVELLNRQDTKYVLPAARLPQLLARLQPECRIVKIKGDLSSAYVTTYYDTADFRLYLQHQNGRVNRCKIRTRTYLNSNQTYIEIKIKDNRGHTRKKRARLNRTAMPAFVEEHTPCRFADLEEKMTIRCNRITLVDHELTERITIDTELSYTIDGTAYQFPGLVILELKQDRLHKKSSVMTLLRELRIFPFTISKYCLGIAIHHAGLKQNRYKAKVRYLNKIASVYGQFSIL